MRLIYYRYKNIVLATVIDTYRITKLLKELDTTCLSNNKTL